MITKNFDIYESVYKIIDIEIIYVSEKFYYVIGNNDYEGRRILKYPVIIQTPDEIVNPELYIDYDLCEKAEFDRGDTK